MTAKKTQQQTKAEMMNFIRQGGQEAPQLGEEKKEEKKKETEGETGEEKKEEEEGFPSKTKIQGLFKSLPGAPSLEQIEKWKAQHDNVYTSAFSDTEVMIWRTLTREEYRNIRMIAASNSDRFTQLDFEEAVVDTCLLWPVPETEQYAQMFKKAGVYTALHDQISQASHFIPAGAVGMFVAEL